MCVFIHPSIHPSCTSSRWFPVCCSGMVSGNSHNSQMKKQAGRAVTTRDKMSNSENNVPHWPRLQGFNCDGQASSKRLEIVLRVFTKIELLWCVCLDEALHMPLNTLRSVILRRVYTLQCEGGILLFITSLINLGRVFPPRVNRWSIIIHHPSICDRALPPRQRSKTTRNAKMMLHPGKKKVLFTLNRSVWCLS